MHRLFILVAVLISTISCSSDSIKKKMNKAGQIAGSATGEFVEGAAKSIEDAFDVHVEIKEELKAKGLELGKCSLSNGTEGKDNLLIVYVIFNEDFDGTVMAKAHDNQMLEMGRVQLPLTGAKNEAKFIEFHFDKRTNIDSDSKLTIE